MRKHDFKVVNMGSSLIGFKPSALVGVQAVSLCEAVFKSFVEMCISLALTSLCVIICNWVVV